MNTSLKLQFVADNRQLDQSEILARWAKFVHHNPQLTTYIVRAATPLLEQGYRTVGMQMFFEKARYDHMLKTNPGTESFKITNDFAPFYARYIEQLHPRFLGFFNTKKSVADDYNLIDAVEEYRKWKA